LKFKLESIIEILMIYKVEIRERKREREKEREAIEIEREVERKVRLGVKCKAVTDK
jgi:hypothetical protein